MTYFRDLYLMFKMDDFEDTVTYSIFLFFSAIISLSVYLLLFSIIEFIGEPLSEFFGKHWNPFSNNPQISIFFLLFLILIYLFRFIFLIIQENLFQILNPILRYCFIIHYYF